MADLGAIGLKFKYMCSMADERIAELIAQSNVALDDSLAKALQGVRGQSAPNVQLSKFVGVA